jgi:hypothetical protein
MGASFEARICSNTNSNRKGRCRSMSWEFIGLAVEIAAGGLGMAWWVVRMFWKIDVRLSIVEEAITGRNRDREQRYRSTSSVLRVLGR